MHEVGCAIKFCHQRNVVHRDIKLENIVLKEKGKINRGLVIIDFGLAGDLQKRKEKHFEGTIRYAPPELMSGLNYHADPSYDVWSMGVLIYRMISGIYPFEGTDYGELKTSIVKQNPKFPDE
jgi:serine/threonine protein kinase